MNKIGLFDSGVGGLTVLRQLVKDYPYADFYYLGDTARLPYGTKSPETLKKYVEQNMAFLNNLGVDMIISACHSASSAMIQFGMDNTAPLYEVITPSCDEALMVTNNYKIGLLATGSTVKSKIYRKVLQKHVTDNELFQQSAPLLVPLVESGWVDDEITRDVLKRYLTPLLEKGIDTLILGCTHYPVLADEIQKICGDSIVLVDPATALSKRLPETLKLEDDQSDLILDVYLTDDSEHFLDHSKQLLGPEISEKLKIHSADFQ